MNYQPPQRPIERRLLHTAARRLQQTPGVVLLGPRQVGKTTLARQIAAQHPGAVFLDLQLPADRAKLEGGAELFWREHREQLVVLDEVQYVPEIFARLRPEIDAYRRPGRFLLLGSASGKLLQQTSESLAGRVAYLELAPLLASEAVQGDRMDLPALQELWLRGGFPRSFTAPDAEASYLWRNDFIATFLARDLREFGVNIPAQTLHRFWRMAAHLHGQLFNASQLAASLGGIAHTTVQRYLDTLADALMLRKLEPHFINIGKRLVKSPKVYVRDSGLLHALLGIPDVDTLVGHPSTGASWEGFCVEQVCQQLPVGALVSFYRTAAGAELDLVVEHEQRKIGIEIKFSSAPKVTKGFWQACEDVGVHKAYVMAPVAEPWALGNGVEVIPARMPAELVRWAMAGAGPPH